MYRAAKQLHSNKSVCLHTICVCTVYIYDVYISTYMYIFKKKNYIFKKKDLYKKIVYI